MHKTVRAAFAVVACLAALGVAGCGDDVEETNAYVEAVNAAQTDFASTIDRLQQEITAQSTADEDDATLGRFEDAIEDTVTRLEAVEPPAEVAEQHEALIAAIEGYGTTIGEAREEFASDDPSEILAARTQLSTDVADTSRRINAAIQAINAELGG